MRPHTGKVITIILTVLVILYVQSCSKDDDFVNRVIDKSASPVANPGTKEDPDDDAEEREEEVPVEEPVPVEADSTAIDSTDVVFIEKSSKFMARQDAHVQDGRGYNLTIVRLDQARRTSYLMFDLSAIDSVGGKISEATLKFTVDTDAGDGDIFIYKGDNNDWKEDSIDESSAPEQGTLLGSMTNEYKLGETIEIALDTAQLMPEKTTLILTHESGNDFAFASKEHPSELGPELNILYNAPEDAPALPDGENDPDEGPAPPTGGETPPDGEEPGTEEPPVTGETPGSEEEPGETPGSGEEPGIPPGEEEPPVETPANEAPVARAGASPLKGPVPLAVSFSGSDSSDDDVIASYAWNFKDGGGSVSINPEHTFDKPGEYEVELTVKDESGLSDTTAVTIVVEEEAPAEIPAGTNQAPVARAGASPLKGAVPLEVSFTGTDSSDDSGISSYTWDFKDGSPSTSSSPKHTFDKAGEYDVLLTVKDEAGLSNTATVTIVVEAPANVAPVAKAGASPLKGPAPLEVSFTGSNSTDDKNISSYAWDFKDGSSSTSSNPNHTFDKAGEYNVLLTVKDEAGLSGTATVTVVVEAPANVAPVAKAAASPLKGPVPLEVSFTGSNSTDDNSISSYAWDFKDGGSSTSTNPKHTFEKAGEYNVVLTVKDEAGLSHTATVAIVAEEAANKAPEAKATASPLSGTLPFEVSFNGSGSTDDNGITSYAWNFKDGGSSTSATPKHTFDAAGTYQVELTVKDAAGLTDVASVNITVNQPVNEAPKAVAGANVQVGDAPLEVKFSSQNSSDDQGIVSYVWDFDNGDTASGQSPSRTFNNPGVYEVSLTVTDGSGLKDSGTIIITVNQPTSGGGGAGGNYPPGAVLASSFGYNSSNATEALHDAIRSNNQIIVVDKQASDWIIEPSKFFNLSNKTIIIASGVVIRAKSGAFPATTDQLLSFVGADNLTLEGYGATLTMNKSEYNSGEARHALGLYGGRDITIKGLTIKDSGGDGIYLSDGQNITIEDIRSLNNRREGMTIASATDVWVRNSEFSSTKGTQPEAGVGLEPNDPGERLVNINFDGCKFYDNNYAGFKVSTHKLNGSSTPISVFVRNSEFRSNARSTSHTQPRTEVYLGSDQQNPVGGRVEFQNVTFNGSQVGVLFSKNSADAYDVIFTNCEARNILQSTGKAAIHLEAAGDANTLGGFTFNNFRLEYSANKPFITLSGSRDKILKNVNGTFTVKEPYNNPPEFIYGINLENSINVDINYTHID